ncbi:MAG TPA: LPS export ABC transporter periplasmic protein LptC [Candidatus Elarobacter sp.]|jgi:hypothetical protein
MTRAGWRVPVALVVLAFLAWVGFEIGRAGNDIAVQPIQQASKLTKGSVNGKRVDGRSWSLDFDSVSMSPDGTQATITKVRDGRLHRAGKPDVLMQADDVTVNRATNDFFVRGPVKFIEPMGEGRTRTFTTVGARYVGATRVLQLDHSSTITDAGATIVVTNMTIDFRTGDAKLGRIEGERPGNLK